jgi:hypothetical protein
MMMKTIQLIQVPDLTLDSTNEYDKVWNFVRNEFEYWGVTRRKCIPLMERLFRSPCFEVKDWYGCEVQIPTSIELLFDPGSEFASISRYLAAHPEDKARPLRRSITHHRTRLLKLLADALFAIRSDDDLRTVVFGSPVVHQGFTGMLN